MSEQGEPHSNNERSAEPSKLRAQLDRIEEHLDTLAQPLHHRNGLNRGRLARFTDNAENWWLIRLLIIVSTIFATVAVALTVIGFWYERIGWREERIARAWQALAMTSNGNSGKADALSYLADQGEFLTGIRIGGDTRETGPFLFGTTLRDTDLDNSEFQFANLENVVFERTRIRNSDFSNARIEGVLDIVAIRDSFMLGTYLYAFQDEDAPTSAVEFRNVVADFTNLLVGLDVPSANQFRFPNPDYTGSSSGDTGYFHVVEASSLRCAELSEIGDHVHLLGTNISGALFRGADRNYPREPNPKYAPQGEAFSVVEDAWFFEDNPPIGLPDETLALLRTVDREEHLAECQANFSESWRQSKSLTFRGPYGMATADCYSVFLKPEVCSVERDNLYLAGIELDPVYKKIENSTILDLPIIVSPNE